MQKRIWKKEVHIAIIREAEDAPTIAEVLRKYNIAQSIYYKWRRQFEAYGEAHLIINITEQIQKLEG
jgi:transposase-like protein